MGDKCQRRSSIVGGALALWPTVEGFVGLGMWLGGRWEGVWMHLFRWEMYFVFGLGIWETSTLGLGGLDLGVAGLGRLMWTGLKCSLVLQDHLPWASMM